MVSIGVIGAGAWRKNHIRVFSEIPRVNLKYICDNDPSKLRSIEKNHPDSRFGVRPKEQTPHLEKASLPEIVVSIGKGIWRHG
jgi:predicted dehydrogenase